MVSTPPPPPTSLTLSTSFPSPVPSTTTHRLKTPRHITPHTHSHSHSISTTSHTTRIQPSPKPFLPRTQFLISLLPFVPAPLPCYASSEPITEQISDKINLESIVVSIDDFFNRYPFFVAGVTFIWLVVIPLTEEYLKKFKFIAAIDAFRKLRDNPSCELVDIRDKRSLLYLPSPKLKILSKSVFQVEFGDGVDQEDFVKKVLDKLEDPGNTTLCILDNFDGKSMEVAELLFKNGFKEAYAIKGGLRGKDGWLAIQETLLPPSTHVFPNRKSKEVQQPDMTEEDMNKEPNNKNALSSTSIEQPPYETNRTSATERTEGADNGSVKPKSQVDRGTKEQSSPYPNYSDMKPPSSPSPQKPRY